MRQGHGASEPVRAVVMMFLFSRENRHACPEPGTKLEAADTAKGSLRSTVPVLDPTSGAEMSRRIVSRGFSGPTDRRFPIRLSFPTCLRIAVFL